MNTKDKLNPAMQARAQMEKNTNLIKTIGEHTNQLAIELGKIFGLTEGQSSRDVLCENILRVAPKWMRECNRLDKRKTNLETIGKKLGINGTPRDVMDRLSRFKWWYSQYKISCEFHMSSCRLEALI